MNKTEKTLGKILLLSMIVLLPSTVASAWTRTEILVEVGAPTTTKWDEIPIGDGIYKVDAELVFPWSVEGELVGYATQYVYGTVEYKEGHDTIYKLKGYGIVKAEGDHLGILIYYIANNWNFDTGEIWAFRMQILCGTGDFWGVRGRGLNVFPNFLLRLNYNPWV